MSAAAGGGGPKNERAAAVRVVIISTQYIETDTVSFKSVVQRLTGKHSHRRYFHTNHRKLPYRKPPTLRPPPSQSKVDPGPGRGQVIGCTSNGHNYMNSSSSVSFSDLNRLLIMDQLPSWNELFQLCID